MWTSSFRHVAACPTPAGQVQRRWPGMAGSTWPGAAQHHTALPSTAPASHLKTSIFSVTASGVRMISGAVQGSVPRWLFTPDTYVWTFCGAVCVHTGLVCGVQVVWEWCVCGRAV